MEEEDAGEEEEANPVDVGVRLDQMMDIVLRKPFAEDSCTSKLNYARLRVVLFMHSQPVQTALLLLLLLDVLVVIAELIIGSHQTCFLEIEGEKCLVEPTVDAVANSSGFFPPPSCGVFGGALNGLIYLLLLGLLLPVHGQPTNGRQ